jgi:predicted metal-dependent HD superfamily phosphohydrolase
MFTRENLHRCLASLGITKPGAIFAELQNEYCDSSRSYHSDRHVSECLKHLEYYESLAEQKDEIEIAIWFHDAIYDTHKSNNEEQSAAWAVSYLSKVGVGESSVKRIGSLIRATKSHVAETNDERLMLDIDLGILGTSPAVFESYDAAIRSEYHWVPEADYKKGRAAILTAFTARKAIYATREFYERFEVSARRNLQDKINELTV